MNIIKGRKLSYDYFRVDEDGKEEEAVRAVDQVDLDVKEGDFVAILGHNGSGKSTLAKHINAILLPTEGTLYVDGKDTKDESKLWEIRQSAGMVFQNPDNQIIGTIVDEDVGFGPENMGVPTKEIWERVEKSLKAVGMWEYRSHSPNKLSGGRNSAWRLPEWWQCVRNVSYWMNRQRCWIRTEEKKLFTRYRSSTVKNT